PLSSLALALEYSVGGGSPLVFRIASYLLYAAGVVAVFLLARRILPKGPALAAALIFAAHPVHVEAVALGVGQSELLVALFGTLMVAGYLARRRSGAGELRARDWTGLALLYVAAGFSKEHGLVLPGLLLGAELILLREEPLRRRLRHLAPGYALLAGLAVLMILIRRAVLGGTVAGTFTAAALLGLSPGRRALTMLAVVPQWARLLLWPRHLQADYSPQEIVASSGLGPAELLGLGIVLAGAAAAWLARRRAPVVSFGLLWMGVALFPVSNLLVPIGIVLAERTLFLPSIGFVLLLGGTLVLFRPKSAALPGISRRSARAPRIASGLVLTALVAVLAVRSAERQGVWRNDAVFRVRGVQDAPRSWRTRLSYASLLFDSGRTAEALENYRQAAELAPSTERWKVRNDLAEQLFARGKTAAAVEQLRLSLAEAPDQETTRHYLVLGYLALGAYRQAAAEADSALARGGSQDIFGELRALADTAMLRRVPPGAIKIRVREKQP
ncbi:MAG TPA: glycosyltransferase family 39 protein, partial [Gemmatimonadales bacterium]|nr:glycosyltransferase family 39 protein [Gemmatimonadales bacterium]